MKYNGEFVRDRITFLSLLFESFFEALEGDPKIYFESIFENLFTQTCSNKRLTKILSCKFYVQCLFLVFSFLLLLCVFSFLLRTREIRRRRLASTITIKQFLGIENFPIDKQGSKIKLGNLITPPTNKHTTNLVKGVFSNLNEVNNELGYFQSLITNNCTK